MLHLKTILISLAAVAVLLTIEEKHFNHQKNIFIEGYDVVSYFSQKPTKGTKANEVIYNGLHFYFANATNKEKFNKNPNSYLPQYGGWCAYAMALNAEKVSVDPKTYKIVNGKLLLFYNSFGTNTLEKWNAWKNDGLHITKADANWKLILQK